MGGGRVQEMAEGLKPMAGMVSVQSVFAGVNIFYKLAVNDGMDMRIMIAYRYLFATACLIPMAYFLERKKRPRLTWMILIQGFMCGLFGGTCSQNFYIASIKLTSATFAAAMINLVPATTFVLAVIFRLENLHVQTYPGLVKVIGTLVGIGGAMLLTFYKGAEFNFWSTNVNILKKHNAGNHPQESTNYAIGSLMAFAACLAYSSWLIVQAKMSKAYPCHYSCTTLMCFMASVQSVVFALCMNHDLKQWRLGFDIRLLSVAYSGIVAGALILPIMNWCINKRGPLYASIFNPLTLVIVAVIGSLILNEKLHVGSIIGSVMIVIGLYIVLWGKAKEAAKVRELPLLVVPQDDEPREGS